MTLFAGEDHETVSWSLKEFSIGKDFKWSKPEEEEDDRTELFVDRATHEFGIVYYDSQSTAAVEQFPDTEEPVYFEAKTTRAACKHDSCGKVTVLFEHVQLNLKFESTGAPGSADHISATTHAHRFVNALEVLAGAAQNKTFRVHTVIAKGFDKNEDFDMVARGYTERIVESWMSQSTGPSHWSKVRDSGEWSDFTIFAGTTPFPVHRVKICEESMYFKAVCTGGFAESDKRTITLPESEQTIAAMLDEIYGTYNSTTGSLFIGFVLRSEVEKKRVMDDLLDLFIAADKYNLEKVKTKVVKAIVDRLPFIQDPLIIVDLATCVFDDQTPQVDRGLRMAIIGQIYTRMPAILNGETAWQEYSENKAVLKAFHAHVARLEMPTQLIAAAQGSQCLSPPATPTRAKRQRIE
ncbi:hypothetical protein E8E11_010392 [Didymella keratinophila]|nr:hypothetical protein E8E11_010392 [Didymella keratinophila]